MAVPSVAELVDALCRYRLLDADRLGDVAGDLAVDAPGTLLVERLIQLDLLTAYQATCLLQGRGRDLALGPYLLLEPLGKGGMGEVFKARQERLGRVVAIKVVRPDHCSQPDILQRFRREARAVAQLKHPNVVTIHDADDVDGIFYIAMEYVEGIDLSKLVKQQGPLPVARACEYARQAALGLQHAYEHGLVHRDVKPSNLMVVGVGSGERVSPTGSGDSSPATVDNSTSDLRPDARQAGVLTPTPPLVKILDFGLARYASDFPDSESLTPTDQWIGTPDFVSPEQARSSKEVDIRADIFSLGCTLYYLLTARHPFQGASRLEKLLARLEHDATPVSSVRPQVAPALAGVLARMLARTPADRFQTPAEAARALEPFCHGESSTTTDGAAPRGPVEASQATTVASHRLSGEETLGRVARSERSSPTPRPSSVTPVEPIVETKPEAKTQRRRLLHLVSLGLVVILGVFLVAPHFWPPDPVKNKAPAGPPEPEAPKFFVNSIGMKLMPIPAGSFLMGAPEDEAESSDEERPQHKVDIKAFWMGAYEVTQDEFAAVLGHNPSHFSPLGAGAARIEDVKEPGKLPVESVSRDDAVEFCKRLTEREKEKGRIYRLPTEAEWEFACRAKTTTPFCYGAQLSAADANCDGRRPYGGAAVGLAREATTPVGSFQPNAFGLYDMHGNVWEWCQDRFVSYAEKLQPGGARPELNHGLRGGAVLFSAADCRSAKRHRDRAENRSQYVGFRVVCEP